MTSHSPSRLMLDAFQRVVYAAREKTNVAEGLAARFVAAMNSDTLKQLGREAAMGGVVALLGLPAACERAAAMANGPTGTVFWDMELVLDCSLGDSEIRMTVAPSIDQPLIP